MPAKVKIGDHEAVVVDGKWKSSDPELTKQLNHLTHKHPVMAHEPDEDKCLADAAAHHFNGHVIAHTPAIRRAGVIY